MMSATMEIILLLLVAGAVGSLAGISAGQVASSVSRRRRTRDNLRRRLLDTQRAIVMLERTVAAESRTREPDTGIRLADRVAAVRGSEPADVPRKVLDRRAGVQFYLGIALHLLDQVVQQSLRVAPA